MKHLHVAVPIPRSLIEMPDSAFKATEPDCQATRACVIVLGTSAEGTKPTLPAGGPVGIVEFYSLRQPRVCRSSLAAELCSTGDAASKGLLIRGMFSELLTGPTTAADLASRTETGRLPVEVKVATDNRGMFNGVTAVEVNTERAPPSLYLEGATRQA